MGKILIIEPFYGGSHKQMIDTIVAGFPKSTYELLTMTAKKWPWRARCSAFYISQQIPNMDEYNVLFCSSVLNLSELIGLRPDIIKLKKIVYFHENQLVYPIRQIKERDFQFGYNQITTCLSADVVIFNSEFNRTSFLENINKFLKIMPDFRLKDVANSIKPKTRVIYFPMDFTEIDTIYEEKKKLSSGTNKKTLHLVWPHRWEFDKNPAAFFDVLYALLEENIEFRVSVLGESFSEEPPEFVSAREKLKTRIENFGYIETKKKYYEVLIDADVVISSADHEFFGVSVLEGVRCGCLPLVPNRLVYPELFPTECLYNSAEDFFKKLKSWCCDPHIVTELKEKLNIDTQKYSSERILPDFTKAFDT